MQAKRNLRLCCFRNMETQALFNRLNLGMTQERFYSVERNLRLNKEFIAVHGGLRPVISMMKDKHIIICGAGPSLEDAYPHLRKIQQRASVVLIAADMAYLPLLRAGIIPHFAISCETTPRDFFSSADTSKTSLLAFSCVCSRTVRSWKSSIYFYNWMLRQDPYERLWHEAGLELGFAATGSIVTSQALSIALGCGARSIMLAGNDLGFFDRCYARGTVRDVSLFISTVRSTPHESRQFDAAWKARHYVIPRGSRRYFTNHQFLAAKYWMEETIAQTAVPVYDAGVPGCAGKNIEKMSVKRYTEMILSSRG